jgi:hypothetical protein
VGNLFFPRSGDGLIVKVMGGVYRNLSVSFLETVKESEQHRCFV